MPLKIVQGESYFLIRSCQLIGAAFRCPLEAALGERRRELREVDSIAPGIG